MSDTAAGEADARFLALADARPPPLVIPPRFSFAVVQRSPGLVWLSGHGPSLKKTPPEFDYVGKVGAELSPEDGYVAARLVGLNLLVSLRTAVDSLDAVSAVTQLIVAVNSAPGFTGQAVVANGCSDLLAEVLGASARPARMAFGAAELPFGMAVEASMVAALR